jgi:hypothetical protein
VVASPAEKDACSDVGPGIGVVESELWVAWALFPVGSRAQGPRRIVVWGTAAVKLVRGQIRAARKTIRIIFRRGPAHDIFYV